MPSDQFQPDLVFCLFSGLRVGSGAGSPGLFRERIDRAVQWQRMGSYLV